MDYLDMVDGYSKEELHIDFQMGKIIAMDSYYQEVQGEIIGRVCVKMDENPNVIGVKYILDCTLWSGSFVLIHNDNDVIGVEFNFSDGNAIDDVIQYLVSRYNVEPAIIDVEI